MSTDQARGPRRPQPLRGVRVLEFAQFLAAPACSLILSDLGADVVKVEDPDGGDAYRLAGPPFIGDNSVPFEATNGDKRSVAVDLRTPDGAALARRLVQDADVVLVSFRTSAVRRLGLDHDTLRAVRPGLIYCAVTGYGTRGARADDGAVDMTIQAESGLMSVTGAPDGEPVRYGVPITDWGTGMFAAIGVLAALRHRDQTGEGCEIDCSLFGTGLLWGSIPLLHYQASGQNQPRTGNVHPHIVPYGVYRAADGWVALSAPTERTWQQLCQVLQLGELAADPDFATPRLRNENRTRLLERLSRRLEERTSADLTQALRAADVPCAPVNTYDVLSEGAEPWLDAAPLLDTPGRQGESWRIPTTPVRLNGDWPEVRRPAPSLGAHTDEVLREAGVPSARLDELRARGVIR
ncbi:MAG: CoA transferase [Actinomycetota bacterium]|jgi:crotonobetainyl-CoA:carnitine CoA-transferase CaiB-like acyl-CoA transferase|nr:CoA transferase [Actinomycetota bacterium]